MKLTGGYRIPAPLDVVWSALNSEDVLRQCIPGCETLVKTTDTTMEAVVVQAIGPVKARFKGSVEIVNIVPSQSYTIQGEGNGGIAGFAKGASDITLAPDGDETILSFEANAMIGGKLARLGNRLIDSTARKLAGRFFDNFEEYLKQKVEPELENRQQASIL